MDLQDRLLGANRFFLVGDLAGVCSVPWASTPDEAARLNHDARSLLTTWGERKASEGADLHDYGNKDWAGLTRDYYRVRDGRPISRLSTPNCATVGIATRSTGSPAAIPGITVPEPIPIGRGVTRM
jgi:hypothetical protein